MKEFQDAKWIWVSDNAGVDEYAEFYTTLKATDAPTLCRISCDGDYTLFINGKYVASNQYGDFEHYKIYDEIEITEHLTEGENQLQILVWHFGEASQRYKPATAGVIFEIVQNDTIIAVSDDNILCRKSEAYRSGYSKKITGQMGFSFFYDARGEGSSSLTRAVCVEKHCNFYPRPIKKMELLPRKAARVLENKGNYYLVDLGEETVGLPVLEFVSHREQKILVAWGEDLQDGHVRRIIGRRDFSYEYVAKAGKNEYTNYMLRLGCRYLELYAEEPISLIYLGVLPVVYHVKERHVEFENALDDRIYNLSVRTLKLSMMEHYVDTPWREQCLYVFDSRNQMLCGYHAFEDKNAEYARANLKLVSEDRRDDGLLSICYPSGVDLTIPSFSLYYFIAVREYLDYTGDTSLAEEVYEKLISIFETFMKNKRDGLVCSFVGKNHWNFYDWSENLDGGTSAVPGDADLVLNCLFILALESLKVISEKINKPFIYDSAIIETKHSIQNELYDEERGAFTHMKGKGIFTLLGNALAILAGVCRDPAALSEKMMNGEFSDCSLSMKCFVYDALLMTDKERWQGVILDEIRANYKRMLDAGATSVWETIGGASAFGNAGSLCHGWSAIPVYYFNIIK
ncbi:MAG: family 78 glycoside hydrolase catalytic domain [Clostridia bacterium]|nr:family 78 glycoside hydrolase catalytic domain [Clostridia bacterium]MBQ8720060.1 family 78 glycoside hydrolase catalytic domain [Clostridia bacterium]